VQGIADAHETATAWREHDDTGATAAKKIRQEVRDRYGIDVDNPVADPRAVDAALEQAERERAQAAEERRRASEDLTASQMLLNGAERRDRDADEATQRASSTDDPATAERADREALQAIQEARGDRYDSDAAYDSAERREALASSLKGSAAEKEVIGRILADVGNAKHPREAVTAPVGQSPKARNRGAGIGQQRDRGGLTR
jgi:colicin import membrane protein